MKKHLSTIFLVLIFMIGLCILLYPAVSDYWNAQVQSRAIVDYEAALANMTQEDYTAYFEEAAKYNAAITELNFPLMYYGDLDAREDLTPYEDILNIDGNGIFGYINIDKIGVHLPIYHGTSDGVLAVAVGHIEGTSVPGGGESTHTVLSSHRGLPSAKLFTDLDELEIGDVFTITVLDRVLTYEVNEIQIVLPNEVDSLYVRAGEDLCTLVTCTPYGINTHRLLVHARRIETVEPKPEIYVPADAYLIDSLIVTPVVAILMLMVLLVFLLVKYRKKR